MDLTLEEFAGAVGSDGPVAVQGHGTRHRVETDARTVAAPAGIVDLQPAEMIVRCGAGTAVDEVDSALGEFGQQIAVPSGGTVGGALATGRSGIRRLGYGAMRDALLQAKYVNAAGKVVKAGGPTVKNVSGFDLCRLLVGSMGTLGFLGEVILRTRPTSPHEQWFTSERDPFELLREVFRPSSLLWDGTTTWLLLEGHHEDVAAQAARFGLAESEGPPPLPTGGRWSMPPSELNSLRTAEAGSFIAEIGVGIVHHTLSRPRRAVDPVQRELHDRIKAEFDPSGRLNPGLDVLTIG